MKNGYVDNIESLSLQNVNFRKVLFTTKNSQLVLMSLLPGQDIGEEVHDVDQFFRVEKGIGKVVINGISHNISDGSSIVVPAGLMHNLINTDTKPMKLYTLYMPPHHRDGTIHATKEDSVGDDEHFDGKTSE
ncbi:MAG: cupin domain-containing protein [Candidatus Paceibacterota bacterium]